MRAPFALCLCVEHIDAASINVRKIPKKNTNRYDVAIARLFEQIENIEWKSLTEWMRRATHLCKFNTFSAKSWCLLIQTVLRVWLRRWCRWLWRRQWWLAMSKGNLTLSIGGGRKQINKHQILLSSWLSVFLGRLPIQVESKNCGNACHRCSYFLFVARTRPNSPSSIYHHFFFLFFFEIIVGRARALTTRMKCQILYTCPKTK